MGQASGLTINRFYSSAEVHPYNQIEWVLRDAVIKSSDGSIVFEQKDIEVPEFWSQSALNVVASRYFRGSLGTPERESSIRHIVDRVVKTIVGWGIAGGYFDVTNSSIFEDELKFIFINQIAAMNTPTWLNLGWKGRPQATSACYLNSVEDSMSSILDLIKTEGILFKMGAGSGTNLSTLRSSVEPLAAGGHSSGVVSFMRALDGSSGAIKSGGSARRSACMRMLNIDHPDIESFIETKTIGEMVANALIASGFSNKFNEEGNAYQWAPYQNSNNSVRVTDEFMNAVEKDLDWNLVGVTDGKIYKTLRARDLMDQIAKAAHVSGDPGILFDSTINAWHTIPNSGRINTTNPCLTGDALITTNEGLVRIDRLTNCSFTVLGADGCFHKVNRAVCTGTKLVYEITTVTGRKLRATNDHLILTQRGDVKVGDLLECDEVIIGEERCHTYNFISGTSTQEWTKREYVNTVTPIGEELVYDITEPWSHHFVANGIIVHNCGEVNFLDDVSCNLASINLMKFLNDDNSFNVKAFRHTCNIIISAMEICVGFSEYPTEKIADVTHRSRPLGLGPCGLGEFLMSQGIPYDSAVGRAQAACIMAIMTGSAYAQSARIAAALGPFEEYTKNSEAMDRIMCKHRDAGREVSATFLSSELLSGAREAWYEAIDLGREHGYRNGQTVVAAPCGTISFMLGSGTTGIEPELALVKFKSLVGGGSIKSVSQNIGKALRSLRYSQEEIKSIEEYVETNDTIEGAPYIKEEHLPVFDCSFKPVNGKRFIDHMGHVRMVASIQPFLSGNASKTTNMPHESTVEDIKNVYMQAWKLGVKSITVYRDGCKMSQPLSTKQDKQQVIATEKPTTVRRRLPDERSSITHRAQIGEHKIYITVGMYQDGTPGEIFLNSSKEGSTISGLLDSFATAISMALQYGVPLSSLSKKLSHTRFEPSGFTGNPDVPYAKSIVDYVFRWLSAKFLTSEEKLELGVAVKPLDQNEIEDEPPNINIKSDYGDSPTCSNCGQLMIRSGSCHTCPSCGLNSGCA